MVAVLGSDDHHFDGLLRELRDPIDHFLRRFRIFLAVCHEHAIGGDDDQVVRGVEAGRVYVGPDIHVGRELFLLRKVCRVWRGRNRGDLHEREKSEQGLHVNFSNAACHASRYLYPLPVLNSTTVSVA